MINDVAASGDEPGAAILLSVFFVKHGLISADRTCMYEVFQIRYNKVNL